MRRRTGSVGREPREPERGDDDAGRAERRGARRGSRRPSRRSAFSGPASATTEPSSAHAATATAGMPASASAPVDSSRGRPTTSHTPSAASAASTPPREA